VKPVNATPGDAPGTYRFTIELEMHGEWALRIEISGPRRDVIVAKLDFQRNGAK
jgi:hypothetical protein